MEAWSVSLHFEVSSVSTSSYVHILPSTSPDAAQNLRTGEIGPAGVLQHETI
jgi:hypothetical protein